MVFRSVEKNYEVSKYIETDEERIYFSSFIFFTGGTKLLSTASTAEIDRLGHQRIYECRGRNHCVSSENRVGANRRCKYVQSSKGSRLGGDNSSHFEEATKVEVRKYSAKSEL